MAPNNAGITSIESKVDTKPSLAQIEASTVIAKEATVSSRASQESVTALGSPMQESSYVAPANADIAAIKTKTDTLVNTDLTAVESDLADIKNNTNLIPAAL